jgi:O-antigen/teichoic acid export membrane protein
MSEAFYRRLARRAWAHASASELRRRFFRGAFWTLTGSIASRTLNLPGSIICARVLGEAGFGKLGIIQSTDMMLGSFAGLGMGATASRYVARLRSADPLQAGRVLALCAIGALCWGGMMAAGLLIFAPLLAERALAAPELTYPLMISSGILLLRALDDAQVGALSGLEAFRTVAFNRTWTSGVQVVCMIGGVFWNGLTGAVWGMIGGLCVSWLLNNRAVRRECVRAGISYVFAGCWTEWRVLTQFSLPAAISGSLFAPVTWIGNAMLVHQPDGYAQMGLFNAASQWRNALLFVPYAVGQAVIPMMSHEFGRDKANNAAKVMRANMWTNAAVTFPVMIGLGLFSPLIMAQYGKGFAGAWPVLLVGLFTAFLMALQAPVGYVIVASGRMWISLVSNCAWGAVFLAANRILVPQGAIGLAMSYLIAHVARATWTFVYAYRLLNGRLDSAPDSEKTGDSNRADPEDETRNL